MDLAKTQHTCDNNDHIMHKHLPTLTISYIVTLMHEFPKPCFLLTMINYKNIEFAVVKACLQLTIFHAKYQMERILQTVKIINIVVCASFDKDVQCPVTISTVVFDAKLSHYNAIF